MARHCQKAGAQNLDEGEYLNVVKHTAEELEELIHIELGTILANEPETHNSHAW